MLDECTVFRAQVLRISEATKESPGEILIVPTSDVRSGDSAVPAQPPSVLPTSILGSGILSMPSPGQECIACAYRGQYYILSYVAPKNISPYGIQIPLQVKEGETVFRAVGFKSASLTISPFNLLLNAGYFSSISLYGDEKKVEISSKNYDLFYAGGFHKYKLNQNTKETRQTLVYTDIQDVRGYGDEHKRPEQGNAQPLLPVSTSVYAYPSKVFYRLGHDDKESNPYYKDIRQNISGLTPYDKNVIISERIGYQLEHERYKEVLHPAGTLYEFTSKKNIAGDVGTFVFRYGKLKSGEHAGEIYREHIQEGLNNNIPLGSPSIDPLGEGIGYGYFDKTKAAFSHLVSIGELKSSYYTHKLESNPVLPTKDAYSYEVHLGKNNLYNLVISEKNTKFSQLISKETFTRTSSHKNSVFEEKHEESLSWKVVDSDGTGEIVLKGNTISLKNSKGDIVKLEKGTVSIIGSGGGTIKIATSGGITLENSAGELIKLLIDLIKALPTCTTPGYGAPLIVPPSIMNIATTLTKFKS